MITKVQLNSQLGVTLKDFNFTDEPIHVTDKQTCFINSDFVGLTRYVLILNWDESYTQVFYPIISNIIVYENTNRNTIEYFALGINIDTKLSVSWIDQVKLKIYIPFNKIEI